MTDESRIERLTELARRVVLAQEPDVNPATVTAEGWGEGEGRCATACSGRFTIDYHPRALDALEAALLVLSGESCTNDVVRELAAKLYAKRGDTLDSIMQLASEWDAQAARQRARGEESAADARECCAQELRERVRQP